MNNKYIGKGVMSLADMDNVSAKIVFNNFDISSQLTRIYKYEGMGVESVFRIFINANVNGQKVPYAVVNIKCGVMTIGKSDGRLRSVYDVINKDIEGDFSKIVKIIKPGNFLWHNLVNGDIHDEKCNVDIYFEKTGHISGKIIGHTKKSRKIGKQSSTPFILTINCEGEIRNIPINIIDLILFKNKPMFVNSQKGIITNLTTELLSTGHICRGEPLAGYVLDVCGQKKRLIYFDYDKFEFFTIPELDKDEHDSDINEIIQLIKCRHCDKNKILRHNDKRGDKMKEYIKPSTIQPENIARLRGWSCWWNIWFVWCSWWLAW